MTPLECHGYFASMPPADARAFLPENVSIDAVDGFDATPALLTAAVELSGRMGDAHDVDDLRDAAAHFVALVNGGLVDLDEWAALAEDIVAQIIAWGDRLAASAQAN